MPLGLRVLRAVGQREYPFIPGMEVSGEVIEVGSAVEGYSVGDRVFGAPLDGAFKPKCLVEAKSVHRIPPGVDPSVCAGFELNYGTAVREPFSAKQTLSRASVCFSFAPFCLPEACAGRARCLRPVPRAA